MFILGNEMCKEIIEIEKRLGNYNREDEWKINKT